MEHIKSIFFLHKLFILLPIVPLCLLGWTNNSPTPQNKAPCMYELILLEFWIWNFSIIHLAVLQLPHIYLQKNRHSEAKRCILELFVANTKKMSLQWDKNPMNFHINTHTHNLNTIRKRLFNCSMLYSIATQYYYINWCETDSFWKRKYHMMFSGG